MSSELSTSAEQRFRQAFERLKTQKPNIVKSGTPVSQNNVAKEAGCDPSALRKSRFPSLIREIQAYVEISEQAPPSKRNEQLKRREMGTELRVRLATVTLQRDIAQSHLVSAQRRIVDLTSEVKTLKEQLNAVQSPPLILRR